MSQVKIFGLGGLDEIGKNMYIVEVDENIFVVEVGLKYPNPKEQLGVEIILPDFKYLIDNKERVKGIFITHAHDDVMGGIPHLLKVVNAPIYTTALTAQIIKRLIKKEKIKNVNINVVKRCHRFKVANIKVETFALTQSIPDGFGLAIHTDQGSVVVASEYLIDYDIRNEFFSSDISKIAEIGKNGVLAFLCESTGSTTSGYTAPRHKVTPIIEGNIENSDGRVFVTVYKQNIYRLFEIIEIANKLNKKIYFYDNSQYELLEMISKLGYYKLNQSMFITKQEFAKEESDAICIVSGTGTRVFKRMHRIALREDDLIQLKENDVVIMVSPPSFESEIEATNMENDLYKEGVKVVNVSAKEILQMRASIEDIKMMIYLLKPKYYIPINGEYRHLLANANIAVDMEYTPDKVVVIDNGQIIVLNDGHLRSAKDFIELEEMLIDGNEKLDVGGMVLKDRETLSTDGVIVVGIVINFKTKELVGGADVQSRGVIYLKDADYIVKALGEILINAVDEAVKANTYENMKVRMDAKSKMSRYMLKETGKRPMILPAIVEINLD